MTGSVQQGCNVCGLLAQHVSLPLGELLKEALQGAYVLPAVAYVLEGLLWEKAEGGLYEERGSNYNYTYLQGPRILAHEVGNDKCCRSTDPHLPKHQYPLALLPLLV